MPTADCLPITLHREGYHFGKEKFVNGENMQGDHFFGNPTKNVAGAGLSSLVLAFILLLVRRR